MFILLMAYYYPRILTVVNTPSSRGQLVLLKSIKHFLQQGAATQNMSTSGRPVHELFYKQSHEDTSLAL